MMKICQNEEVKNNREKSCLDFIWISKFRNIKNQGFLFSRKYRYQYDDETKILTRTKDDDAKNHVESFFDDQVEVNAVVGKNGCGKTNLLLAIYACLGNDSSEIAERAILVFRDGTVYTLKCALDRDHIGKKWAVQKFKGDDTELHLKWNDAIKIGTDLRCIYHSDVMDFQAIDFCRNDIYNYTNVSTASLLTQYLDSHFSSIREGFPWFSGDANQLIKGFFFEEFRRQLQFYKIISQKKIENLELPVPQYAAITLKSIETLQTELQQRFPLMRRNLNDLFRPMIKENNIDGTLCNQFKIKLSPCILAGMVHVICFKIEADNGPIQMRGQYNSQIPTDRLRCNIALELLVEISRIAKKKIKNRSQSDLSESWALISEIVESLRFRSELKEQLFREKSRDGFLKSFCSLYLNQKEIKVRPADYDELRDELEEEYGKAIDAEIEHDLDILSSYAESFDNLIQYLSNQQIISNKTEPSTYNFKVNIAGGNADGALNLDLMTILEEYRPVGIIYDYMNFSWNLSSGEYARWTLFARIYEQAEYRQMKLDDEYRTLILLLDEADMLLHPEWQRNYVEQIITFAKTMFPGIHVQVIIATHSPIMLSDIPKQNILFLTVDHQKEPGETFASNIFALYQDSFFLEDSGIGTFAKKKLKDIVKWIHEGSRQSRQSNDELEALIESVGDVYLRAKLKNEYNMYRMEEPPDANDVLTNTIIQQRDTIQKLKEQLEKYKKKLENTSNDKD